MTPQEKCTQILANCKPYGDCLLWQGPVDNKGYGITRDHQGKQVVVHRYLKLFEADKTDEQRANLSKFYTKPCKEFTHCCNTAHIQLSASKAATEYQELSDWRKVYGTEVRGL